MFEVLAEAIEELEVPADSVALTEGFPLLDRLTAKLTVAVAGFDAQRLWDLDGDTSQTASLRRNAGMTGRDATVVARTAKRLRSAPVTAAAWLEGAVLATALRLAASDDAEGGPVREPSHRCADAFVDVCRFLLDHQQQVAGGRHRPHVNLVVDFDERAAGDPTAGRAVDGAVLTPEAVSRYLCDCNVHRVVTSGRSTILDYGTSTRTIPAPLSNALVVRDRHCRWAGCDRRASWAKATTCTTGSTAAPPAQPTSSCSARDTTTEPTSPAGTSSSSPTPPSR